MTIPDELKPKCEVVDLGMICVCGDPSNGRRDSATALYERAKELLTYDPDKPCTDVDFLSRAVANLHWAYNADFECAMDQWFGACATVQKYIDCEHGVKAEKLTDEKIAAGMDGVQAVNEAHEEAACPDEPECFVYEFVPILKVHVQCDRLEHGLAQLVIWFHESRKESAE